MHVSVPIAPRDDAGCEHRVADCHGVLIGPQARCPHGAHAAYVVDETVGGKRLEAGRQPLADRLGAFQQAFVAEHIEIPERGGAGRGVTGVRVAVAQDEVLVGFQRLAHPRSDDHPTDLLVPGGHRLGEGDHVGNDVKRVGREPRAQPSEPGDHLVEDEQGAVAITECPRFGEVTRWRREHPTGTLDRLDQEGGDFATAFGHQHGQRLDVVRRGLNHVGDEGSPALPVRLDPLRAGPAEVRPVIAALAADDDGALRLAGEGVGEAGELERRVDGLRPRPAEEHTRRRNRGQLDQALGELVGRGIGEWLEARVGLDRLDLGGNGVGDLPTTVADVAVPQARHGVDQLGTVRRPEQGTLAAHDRDERRSGRLGKGMKKAVDHRREGSRRHLLQIAGRSRRVCNPPQVWSSMRMRRR